METHKKTSRRPELVFGMVGPAGTRLDDLAIELKGALAAFGYVTEDVRLSALLPNFTGFKAQTDPSEFGRIRHLQDMGDAFRSAMNDGAAVALAGIAAIRERRLQLTGSPDLPADAHAYLMHQLKHPAEVDLLREVYGSSFLLVGGHAPRITRIHELSRRMAAKENQPGKATLFEAKATEVIDVDQEHGGDFGQNTRDTYPRADFFANLALPSGQVEVRRFVDLLFGHPFRTPSPPEYAMYLATAVSLRSSDSARQVGAAVVSLTVNQANRVTNADVIASGINEVPRGGGGFYWDSDSPDARDQWLKRYKNEDRATNIKTSALAELIEKIREQRWLTQSVDGKPANTLADMLLPFLRGTQFRDIGEFGRPVHAEMAALIDAARRGVSVNGHSMYVTTFPCHNCAKHIIAAGLREVVYLEPYPKSRADFLHGEELSLDPEPASHPDPTKVTFYAFTGIAPRQYQQLFSMTERGSRRGLTLEAWESSRATLIPRYVLKNAAAAYVMVEREVLDRIPRETYANSGQSLHENSPPVTAKRPASSGPGDMTEEDKHGGNKI
jgi:deoxycytidylate deaminase